MKRGILHIGDRVIVREWDDMAAEYKTVITFGEESIFMRDARATEIYFPAAMKYLCGKTGTIRNIQYFEDTDCKYDRLFIDFDDGVDGGCWNIISEMVNLASAPQGYKLFDEAFDNMLRGNL